jgi:hypothetical protein
MVPDVRDVVSGFAVVLPLRFFVDSDISREHEQIGVFVFVNLRAYMLIPQLMLFFSGAPWRHHHSLKCNILRT